MTDQVTFCFIIHFGKQMGEPQFISIRFRKKSYSAAATATLTYPTTLEHREKKVKIYTIRSTRLEPHYTISLNDQWMMQL